MLVQKNLKIGLRENLKLTAVSIIKELGLGRELIIETSNLEGLRGAIYKNSRYFGKRFKVIKLQENYIKVKCVKSVGLFTEYKIEVDLPKQDYAKAKKIIEVLANKNMFIKTFVQDVKQFTDYIHLLRDRDAFYTITQDQTYRTNEIKVTRVK